MTTARGDGARDLQVLFSFFSPRNRSTDNPYFADLVANLESNHGVQPMYIKLRTLLARRIDVIHIQWPEFLVKGSGVVKNPIKWLFTSALLARAYISRVPVVRTVHNLAPHEKTNFIGRFFLNQIDKATDFRILLNDSTQNDYSNAAVILHPKYDRVADLKRKLEPSCSILAFGAMRPYKGFEDLIRAFKGLTSPDVSLLLAGKPHSKAYGEELQELAHGDQRISLRQTFIPEEALQHTIADSDLVVLPYRDIYNSGAALLALSLGVPILATRSPSTESLQAEVGSEWVYLFEGELTTHQLQTSHEEAIKVRQQGEDVNLDRRDLATNAELHWHVYKALKHGRRVGIRGRLYPKWSDAALELLERHSMKNFLSVNEK